MDWADVGAGAAGGAVAGAVVGATAGALTGDPSTLIVGGAILGAAAGGAGGAAQSVAGDVLHGRPVDGGKALTSAAVDAVAGIVGGAVGGAVVVAGGGAIVAGAASGAAGGAVGGGLQAGLNGGSIVAGTLEGAALGVAGGVAAGALCNTAQRLLPAPKGPVLRVNTPKNAANMKLGELLTGVPDDAMIHLSPEAAKSFVPGVNANSYWVRFGDVKHLTVGQYKRDVVLAGASASELSGATFVIKREPLPGQFKTAPEGAGEYLNSGKIAPDEIVTVPEIRMAPGSVRWPPGKE